MSFDPAADPFQEQSPLPWRRTLRLLGGCFDFESNSRQLLSLVDQAYAGLPRHRRLWRDDAPFRISLRLVDRNAAPSKPKPPSLRTVSGPGGLICGIMDEANFTVVSPPERTGLVVVSRDMLRYPYQVRYELIEFAVFVLASRAQGLVPLHAACVGRGGRGLLLIGSSGAGKSTLAFHCLMLGMSLLAEDSVFVKPERMLATGISNFLHLRRDSLPFVDDASMVARVRKSPTIRRRSGIEKFEVDVRRLDGRVAASALRIEGIVFLSTRSQGRGAALVPLTRRKLMARLTAAQPYPAQLPSWKIFVKHLSGVRAFELRRGQHPTEAAVALRLLLD